MGANLVSLAQYKAYAGITSTTSDATITAIIPKVSELVKSLCRRTFVDYVSDAKTEVFNDCIHNHYFSETPLIALSSVEYSEDYGSTYTTLAEFTDYVVDNSNESLYFIGNTSTNKVNAFKITYTGGYETLPSDLHLAIMDLVTYYLKNDGAVHSPKAPGTNSVQIEYVTSTSLPAHIRRVLDLYSANYL